MPKKILFIEDEECLSDIYKIKFKKEGYRVSVARDGVEGVSRAKKELPDLIFLDLVMPKMDGYHVLVKLRNGEKTKNIKIYILSNLGQQEEISKGLESGANGYFIKANLTPGQLLNKVKQIFKDEEGAAGKGEESGSGQNEDEISSVIEKPPVSILLIEDEEAIINMYKLCFQNAGYNVEVARNGAWGLKLASQKTFGVIVMDMVMPAMNGYEAIKKLKSDNKTKNIPIIILSNSAQDRDMAKARKLGAAGFMLKTSITPSKLVKEVERVIGSKK